MLIVADTHVHVYRGYDVAAALHHGLRNLTELARRCGADPAAEDSAGAEESNLVVGGGPLLVLFLVEAEGCDSFEALRQGRLKEQLPGWSVQAAGEDCAVWLEASETGAPEAERLLLVAGRQLVTQERLEVLALATDAGLPQSLDSRGAIASVHEAGGVPVLSWAPGKWSFQRGELVAAVIAASSPEHLLIGDSSLRSSATEPRLMRRAQQRGFKVVAGSDPLPIGGEERILGSYGTFWRGEVEMDEPLRSLRPMLLDPAVPAARVGDRSTALVVVSRLGRHTLAKKLGGSKLGRSND